LLVLLCVALPGTGCDGRKQEIQTQLDALTSQRDRIRQSISDQRSALDAMRQRLEVQNAE
jgi:Spy/CpxP family protein refolding chaperone